MPSFYNSYKPFRNWIRQFDLASESRRSAFALILLMDDWFIISPKVSATLNEHVDRLLAKAGLPDIVQRIPYLITSANEFETGCQIIAQVGTPVISMRSTDQAWTRSLLGVVQANFEAQMSRCTKS